MFQIKHILFLALCSISLFAESSAQPKNRGKLFLIHGIINHNTMSTFRRIGKKQHWDVEQYKYPSRDKTIEGHAEDLVVRLNEIAKDGKPINFIAFSMGGLILRAALNHPDCPQEAFKGKMVVISSPLRGSKIANIAGKLALGRKILGDNSGRQLRETPHNGFAYHGEFPEGVPLLIISGSKKSSPLLSKMNDGIVSSHEACPDTPHAHQYVHAHHKFFCQNPLTIDKALAFLDNDNELKVCQKRK